MRPVNNRKMEYLKFFVPRRKGVTVRVVLVGTAVAALVAGWWLSDLTSKALLFPYPQLDLDHFRLNRSLKSYLDNITLLIQPLTSGCKRDKVVAVVTSTPLHFEHRMAIRNTWGKHMLTFFLLGLTGTAVEDLLAENYVEAKEYRDIIVYQFHDHYQNLTIKTALLMKWAVDYCPTKFLFKVDDDILVNPWTLETLLQDHVDADLIGYRKDNTYLHRDEYNKWYTPKWLHRQDHISQYLSGTAYLVNGRHLENILNTAYEVPMINLEDVYFTYMVANVRLGLNLTHDGRLSPYKPWIPTACFYWGLASAHSHTPHEITKIWPNLNEIGEKLADGRKVCEIYKKYFTSEMFLY